MLDAETEMRAKTEAWKTESGSGSSKERSQQTYIAKFCDFWGQAGHKKTLAGILQGLKL